MIRLLFSALVLSSKLTNVILDNNRAIQFAQNLKQEANGCLLIMTQYSG